MSGPRFGIAHLALLLVAAGSLGGCAGLQEAFGLARTAPDEFSVVSKAPLVLPPNSNLRPPEPGAPRPQEAAPRDTAQSALLGRRDLPGVAGRSAGEVALLRQAGADRLDPNIRQLVNSEYTQLAERDQSFADRLIFWQKTPPPGEIIDAEREAQRLRQNAATGQPVTTGETPVIERRKRAIFEGIFN
ncbi:MAG: DUF3035 domain-containing protein [Alphaproteobacteria bacterium]|nr:DUF3035 domain-containing protein [Alphaproteobacteria bacterium]